MSRYSNQLNLLGGRAMSHVSNLKSVFWLDFGSFWFVLGSCWLVLGSFLLFLIEFLCFSLILRSGFPWLQWGRACCAVVLCSGYRRSSCTPEAVDVFGEALNPSRVCKPLQGGAPHTYRAEMAAACSS